MDINAWEHIKKHTGGFFNIGTERWKVWGGGHKMEIGSVFPPLAEQQDKNKNESQPAGSALAVAGQQTAGGKNASTSGPPASGAGANA